MQWMDQMDWMRNSTWRLDRAEHLRGVGRDAPLTPKHAWSVGSGLVGIGGPLIVMCWLSYLINNMHLLRMRWWIVSSTAVMTAF